MQIKRLRLTGFKSFVDPADLRIEPGLTGIVGPNGCGKSNLLEALRWTMGENSAKSMRGAGMEDVIFAGTATRPQRDFAEVSILAEQPGDDGELEVVRRIERGAGSAYRINGRDVRAKDVALIFADSATGAHSPALVSQGRIGAIIMAKPGERRQMLEEAAGISGLHVRRKDAEQKLRATETNLTRLDEVIGDQEARATALKRQARQAERYRELSDKIRTAEGRMIFARWREAASAADAAKKEAGVAEALVAERTQAQENALAAQRAVADRLAAARARRCMRWPGFAASARASSGGSPNWPTAPPGSRRTRGVRARWRTTPPMRWRGWRTRQRRCRVALRKQRGGCRRSSPRWRGPKANRATPKWRWPSRFPRRRARPPKRASPTLRSPLRADAWNAPSARSRAWLPS